MLPTATTNSHLAGVTRRPRRRRFARLMLAHMPGDESMNGRELSSSASRRALIARVPVPPWLTAICLATREADGSHVCRSSPTPSLAPSLLFLLSTHHSLI